MDSFTHSHLHRLWGPREDSSGEDNGQVTIVGGSSLFYGAPLLAVSAASRLVDMVFFSSPDKSVEDVAHLKARLNSFIWVPWSDVEAYIAKSDVVLIGPGMMRYPSERSKIEDLGSKHNEAAERTRGITWDLLSKFPNKQWVIDAGSLQTMNADWIPKGAILTPNMKEFELLFNCQFSIPSFQSVAKMYQCIIVSKGPVSYVTDGETIYEIHGGNAGLTKGGTGDTLAGLIAGLSAKNPPLLAAAAGCFLLKHTAEELFDRYGYGYNADDLAVRVFETKKRLVGY